MKCFLFPVLLIGLVCWIQSSLSHWLLREMEPSACKQSTIRIVHQSKFPATTQSAKPVKQSQPKPESSRRYLSFALSKLEAFVSGIAVNNTVMTTVTDFGYLGHMLTFYAMSHLEQYPNFFVTALDVDAYRVWILRMTEE